MLSLLFDYSFSFPGSQRVLADRDPIITCSLHYCQYEAYSWHSRNSINTTVAIHKKGSKTNVLVMAWRPNKEKKMWKAHTVEQPLALSDTFSPDGPSISHRSHAGDFRYILEIGEHGQGVSYEPRQGPKYFCLDESWTPRNTQMTFGRKAFQSDRCASRSLNRIWKSFLPVTNLLVARWV